jgi:hypothetical protein
MIAHLFSGPFLPNPFMESDLIVPDSVHSRNLIGYRLPARFDTSATSSFHVSVLFLNAYSFASMSAVLHALSSVGAIAP